MKNQFILLIFLLPLISCSQTKKKTQNPIVEKPFPNIILLIGDDQGYPYFGFMGADYVQTPNMDKLAESGIVFTNGYVPENHCRPSLQSLMTGTLPIDYNQKVEELLNEELRRIRFASPEQMEEWKRNFRHHAMKHFQTLPKILEEVGYQCFQGGKWWEFNYENGGFTHGMTTGWTAEERKNGGKWFKQFMGGSGLKLARATMQPVYDFIDAESDKPFFIWYAPELPHYPFDAPEKYYNIYKDENMTESAKRYYANCTWFDDGVGELMRYLKEKEAFKNTLFIYVNDNGWEQNPDQEFRHDSLRWHNGGDKGKLSMYDQSFRTPIIFSWENQLPKSVKKGELIHSTDIPATILSLLNLEIPEEYFGKSYRSILFNGDTTNLRTEIIGNINKVRDEADMMGKDIEGYWMRTGNWFFNWDAKTDEKMLFDVEKDPENNENLATEYPGLVRDFMERLKKWKMEKRQ